MIKTTLLAMLLALAAVGVRAADPPANPTAPSTLGPQELVENSAKRMLVELDANRAMYSKDPAKLDALVANVLLPNFDTEYAARLVLVRPDQYVAWTGDTGDADAVMRKVAGLAS